MDVLELKPEAVCVSVHPAMEFGCPICSAEVQEPCVDEGEELPPWAVHVGRTTGGTGLTVEHSGEFSPDGGAILKAVDN